MEPVVYDFAINDRGTAADALRRRRCLDAAGLLRHLRARVAAPGRPAAEPGGARRDRAASPPPAARIRGWPARPSCCLAALFPQPAAEQLGQASLQRLLEENGFDPELHEQIRADLRAGRIGLAQNRLPASTADRGRRPRTT